MLGCFATDGMKEGPTATAGVIHIAGVYNGVGTSSKRAELPGMYSVYPISASSREKHNVSVWDGDHGVQFGGAALDLETGVFVNRTVLPGCGGVVLEQRWYAHRSHRSLLVHEMELRPPKTHQTYWDADTILGAACAITFASCNVAAPNSVVTNTSTDPASGTVERSSRTKQSETPTTPLVTIGQVYQPVPPVVTLDRVTNTRTFLAVLHTSIAAEGSIAHQPLDAARRDLGNFSQHEATLMQSHLRAWDFLRVSRVELSGSGAVSSAIATAVNSSMFYLLSAAREDWPYSTSPGGIANNAYLGCEDVCVRRSACVRASVCVCVRRSVCMRARKCMCVGDIACSMQYS